MKKIVLLFAVVLAGYGAMAQDNKTDKKREIRKIVINGDEKPIREYRINGKLGEGIRFFGIPDLTDEQKTKLKDLQTAYRKESRHTNNLINEKKARLKTLQDEDPVNQKAVNATIDELTALQGKQMKDRVDHKIKVNAILTPEQREASKQSGSHGMKMWNSGMNFRMGHFPTFGAGFQLKDSDIVSAFGESFQDIEIDFDGEENVSIWKFEE